MHFLAPVSIAEGYRLVYGGVNSYFTPQQKKPLPGLDDVTEFGLARPSQEVLDKFWKESIRINCFNDTAESLIAGVLLNNYNSLEISMKWGSAFIDKHQVVMFISKDSNGIYSLCGSRLKDGKLRQHPFKLGDTLWTEIHKLKQSGERPDMNDSHGTMHIQYWRHLELSETSVTYDKSAYALPRNQAARLIRQFSVLTDLQKTHLLYYFGLETVKVEGSME